MRIRAMGSGSWYPAINSREWRTTSSMVWQVSSGAMPPSLWPIVMVPRPACRRMPTSVAASMVASM